MKQVTYAQLDRVLASLGFSIRVATVDNKLRIYEHAGVGARLALAYHPDNEFVRPHHLVAVQGTLEINGIADPLDFAAELQEAG